MSLIHLLAVGRSLGTIRDRPSRYKMTQQNLLPRFGSGKDAEPGLEASEQDGDLNASGSWAEPGEVQQSPDAGKNGKELANVKSEILEQSQSSAGVARGAAGMVRTAASPWKGWSLLGNPFRPKGAAREPVQVELVLDTVRPVRNDLRDTDLEVVAARKTVPPLDPSGAGAIFEKVGKLLSRLRAGLFRFRTKQP